MYKLKSIIENINEKWAGSTRGYDGEVDIYLNPSRKEIAKCADKNSYNAVRFFTILGGKWESKEVYVWDAEGLMHNHISYYLDYGNYYDDYLYGVAIYKNGKLQIDTGEIYSESYINEEEIEDIKAGYYDWLGKYHFDIESLKG